MQKKLLIGYLNWLDHEKRKMLLRLGSLFLFLIMFGFQQNAMAQTNTLVITGKVVDKSGESIPGVQVMVKGTSIGVTTNIDGVYSISVPIDATTLLYTFIGMEKQEVEISGRSTIDITMEEDIMLLGEVIVVGYGTKGKNEITGSTVQVSGEELAQIPVTSVDQALQGKVAGLNISTTSGTPGATQDIRIRGVGSLTAGNDPLFVIDGVPVMNSNMSGSSSRSTLTALASLNSDDVQSITVLKDASATSAYGARGSNGVIVITTKRGKSGETKFNLSSSYGFQNDAREGRVALTSLEKEELFLEGQFNTYGEAEGFTREETANWVLSSGADRDGKYTNWIAAGRPEGAWDKVAKNENAPIYNLSLSASGGDEISSFYASMSYNKTEATVVNNEFERITGALNYNRNLRDNVKFSTNANVSNVKNTGYLEASAYYANPRSSAFFQPPWISPFNEDGTPAMSPGDYNYLYLAEHDITYNDYTRALSNTKLEWEIIKDLKFTSRISLDYAYTFYKNFANRNYGGAADEGGTATNSKANNFNYVTQNSLDYLWVYKDNHRISFKALMEFQKNKRDYLWGYGESVPTDGLTNIETMGANKDATSSYTDWMNLSYLGMINYNYLGRYIADFTIRREGSSRFVKDYRYGTFWSAGAAWNISQEDFLSDIKWINNLRLRASYGLSGSSAIGINQYQAFLYYDADYDNNAAAYPGRAANPFLTWEKNKNYDIGIDFGFLDNKVSGSVAYYNKKTYDLLQDVPTTLIYGASSDLKNVGEMVNKGIEFIVNVDIVRSEDLNIDASFNIGTVDNEVTELATYPNGDEINIIDGYNRIATGHPMNEWYMKKWAGVDPADGSPMWYLNGVDGEITHDFDNPELKEAFQGKSPIPTYTGGVNLHIDYKGFFLDANASFQGGNAVMEYWSKYFFSSGRYSTYTYGGYRELLNRWQKPGDITNVPKIIGNLSDGYGDNASQYSSRFLYDGDYVRLKDFVIGYDFQENILSKLKLDGVRVYMRGTNLLTWVKDKDLKYDPEVRADGYTGLRTPPVKSITFGVNVKF